MRFVIFSCLIMSFLISFSEEIKGGNHRLTANFINDGELSSEKKDKLIKEIKKYSPSEQVKSLISLAETAKRQKKQTFLCELYSEIAHNYLFLGEVDKSKTYLDLAAIFFDKVTDNNVRGLYYYVWGDFYNMNIDEVRSHEYYYKAIHYYEKSPDNKQMVVYIFHNMAFGYIQKEDIPNLKLIIDRLQLIAEDSQSDTPIQVILLRLKSYYYTLLFEKEKNETLLDSAIITNKKVIELFESDKGNELHPEEIAYNYLSLAGNYIEKEQTNFEEVSTLIEKATSLSAKTDTALMVNCLWVKGQALQKEDKLEDAKNVYREQISIMQKWTASENLFMYVNLYHNIADVSAALEDYEGAYFYNKKEGEYRAQILNNEKYQIISDLQTKYETQKKEEKIREQKKIIFFLVLILLLLLSAIFIAFRWARLSKNLAKKMQKIIRLEKEGARHQIQITKSENNDKDHYSDIIEAIEARLSDYLTSIPEEQKYYLDKLSIIDRDSIYILKKKEMTDLQIQYCICFALGMKKEHISLCYNIVNQTIRKNRTTLKSNLDLEKDDNLDVFLIDLFFKIG